MKTLISGHRRFKLENYNIEWIKEAVFDSVEKHYLESGMTIGLSGMASGVDLWFCETCFKLNIPFIACPPFEEQIDTIPKEEMELRSWCMKTAKEIWKIRNSSMVEKCDSGIIIWDGNKGGTHNVLQQMVEKQKPFIWINPVSEKTWNCF